jgi:dienelactone hydrolase
MPSTRQVGLRTALCIAFASALVVAQPLAAARQTPRSLVAEVASISVPTTGSAAPDANHTSGARAMRTLVFKPQGSGPFPVLLFAHGRPAYAKERAQLMHPMSYGHVRYWLGKGYAVVAPIRPGYGLANSSDLESSGVAYSASGQCLRSPQPQRTAQAAAHAQRAALDWVRQQPWARANHIVLEGQSVGGLATVALCAAQPPGVVGCINFSGGAGGNPLQAPARMCQPEQTTQLMRQLGSQPQPPSLWLYAQNDLYWGPDAPKQWHAAFSQAAQSSQNAPHTTAPAARSTFVQTPPIGSDGHSLLRAGKAHWAAPLEAWLKQHAL